MSANQKKNTTPAAERRSGQPRPKNLGLPAWTPWAVALLTGLLYLRAIDNSFTYIDDDYYILRNQYLRDFSVAGIRAIFTHFYSFNYHPLTTIGNLIEYRLFGLNPLPFHLVNVLLHMLNVWLVYKVVERLSASSVTALVTCVLFAVHPMHVESVAWVAERKDVLYTAFYLASLWAYLRYIAAPAGKNEYILALLLFTCSLLSKSAAVTLPVLLLAVDLYKGRKLTANVIIEKIPFLLLSVLFGVLAIMSQKAGGAVNDLSKAYNPVQHAFLLLSGLSAYFIKLVLPFGLSAIHYFPDLHGGGLPWYYYLSLPFLAAIGWLIARPSPYRKDLIFGVSFFLIAISVMLQVITVGAAIYSERYTYVSYIGLFYVIGRFAADKWETPSANTVMGVLGVFTLVFAVGSWDRIGYWKNSDTLFADIVEKNPDNWQTSFVYNYWGIAHRDDGNHTDAINDYTKAIQLKPDYEKAYFNRALSYEATHQLLPAINDYNKAIAIRPDNPQAYNARGWAYFEQGDNTAALKDYNTAIAQNVDYPEVYNNRGWMFYTAGDSVAAMKDYDHSISLDPSFAKPYYNRAAIKMNMKDLKGAIDDYTTLIRIHPDDNTAYFSRGVALYMMKSPTACNDWRKAAQLGSKDAIDMLQQYCK